MGVWVMCFIFTFFKISYLFFWTAWASYLISLRFTFGICKTRIISTSTRRVVLKIKQIYICKVIKQYIIYILKMVPITIIAVSSCFYFLYSFFTSFSSMRKWKKDFALPLWNTNLSLCGSSSKWWLLRCYGFFSLPTTVRGCLKPMAKDEGHSPETILTMILPEAMENDSLQLIVFNESYFKRENKSEIIKLYHSNTITWWSTPVIWACLWSRNQKLYVKLLLPL